jgi:hypothetical protein
LYWLASSFFFKIVIAFVCPSGPLREPWKSLFQPAESLDQNAGRTAGA